MGAWLHWERKNYFRILQQIFSFGGWLRRPGGQGGFRPPPYAPLDPLYPLQTAEGYPRTPLVEKGVLPLVTRPTGAASGTRSVWPGARNQSGAVAPPHFVRYLSRGTYRCKIVLPWRFLATTPGINRRPGAGGGISCAEGDSGPPRDGCKASWARPCEASGALLLSNGGSGGGHETCTLWPPPAAFGYFPMMESTSPARWRAKPPTRNKFLAEGRKRAYLSFSRIAKDFASAEAARGLSDRPLDPFGFGNPSLRGSPQPQK